MGVCSGHRGERKNPSLPTVVLEEQTQPSHIAENFRYFDPAWFAHRKNIMAETNGADAAAAKKVVMITGGTGLVGCGIKEFVESDAEVSSNPSLPCFIMGERWRRAAARRGERGKRLPYGDGGLPAHTFPGPKSILPLTPPCVAGAAQEYRRRLCEIETHDNPGNMWMVSLVSCFFDADSLLWIHISYD